MPFLVERNRDGSYKITNYNTGRVHAYGTFQPCRVMSIVERTSRASNRRRARKSSK